MIKFLFLFLATPNPQVEEKVKAGKYVPPSMREGANRRGESMTPSRTRGKLHFSHLFHSLNIL